MSLSILWARGISEEERKSMDREDKIQTAVAIIFMIVFWTAVGFAVIKSFI